MTSDDIAALIERLEAKADEIAEDVDDEEAEQHWQEIQYMRQAVAALRAQQAEIEMREGKLAQAVQVIGNLLDQAGTFEGAEGQRAMDYFSDTPVFDEEFLPWPRP